MSSTTPADPEKVEALVRDLIKALKELRTLRSRVCNEELPPTNIKELTRDFHKQLLEVKRLQRQLHFQELLMKIPGQLFDDLIRSSSR